MPTFTDVDPTSKIWKQDEWKSVIAPQKTEEENFMKDLWGTIGGFTPLDTLYQKYSSQYGLPQVWEGIKGAATQVGDITGKLADMPYRIAVETAGKPVTQTQLSNLQAKRTQPFQQALNTLAGTIQGLQTTAATYEPQVKERMGYAQSEREAQLYPYKYKADLLTDRWARELTGWTTEKEGRMNEYFAKLQIQGNLDLQDLQNAGQLALEEKKYQTALASGGAMKSLESWMG